MASKPVRPAKANDGPLMPQIALRPYATADEDAAIELWRRT